MKNICLKSIFVMMLLSSTHLSYANDPIQEFEGFNLQGYTDDGEKSWDVNGDTANIVGTAIALTNVVANSYGDEDAMQVTAENGLIDQISGQMHLENDVILTGSDNLQMMTDSIDWNRTDQIVRTEEDIVITNDSMTVKGEGFYVDTVSQVAEIYNDVNAVIDVDGVEEDATGIVTVTSDGSMTVDQKKHIAIFQDNVVAIQDGQTLKSDKMEIYFNSDMSGVLQIICDGNVEIVQGENKSYASKAVYNALTQKMVLSGRPKLVIDTEGDEGFAAFGN